MLFKSYSFVFFIQNIIFIFNGNKLDLYACLTQLKVAIEIEYNICKSSNNEIYFNKYMFIYDSL